MVLLAVVLLHSASQPFMPSGVWPRLCKGQTPLLVSSQHVKMADSVYAERWLMHAAQGQTRQWGWWGPGGHCCFSTSSAVRLCAVQADVTAGLTVGVMVVPQSMSYAQIAGLPSNFGLYAAFIPVLAYALFGSSRQLVSTPVLVARQSGCVSQAAVASSVSGQGNARQSMPGQQFAEEFDKAAPATQMAAPGTGMHPLPDPLVNPCEDVLTPARDWPPDWHLRPSGSLCRQLALWQSHPCCSAMDCRTSLPAPM